MAPDKEAQHADRKDRKNHRSITKDGFAGEGRKDMRRRTHARQDRDVDFGVAKEPEQMLPQQRRPAGMRRYQVATDKQAAGNKEAGAGNPIEQQQNAAAQQHRK